MQRFRVTGAYRDSGEDFEGDFVALNEAECAEQASRQGIVTLTIQPAPGEQSKRLRNQGNRGRLPSQQSSVWRDIIRCIATVNAYLLMIPGLLALVTSIVVLLLLVTAWIVEAFDGNSRPSTILGISLSAAFAITGIAWAILLMLASAVLFLLLFVEDHLFVIRRTAR